jgi:hypothetical protein
MRRVILKTMIVTRKKAPKFAKRIVKSVALTTAVEALFHHKPPDGSVVIDVSMVESLEVCIKILSHI